MKVADLQKSITDNIAKDYPGFTIKEASMYQSKQYYNLRCSCYQRQYL